MFRWGNAVDETRALAEHLSAPVVNSYLHNDSFPVDHPIAVGPIGYCGSKAAMRTIAKADVVLALGSRLGPFGTLPQYDIEYWPKDAKVIQVDIDPKVLGLTQRVEMAVLADARAFTAELLSSLKSGWELVPNRERMDEVEAARRAWDEELESKSSSTAEAHAPAAFSTRAHGRDPESRHRHDRCR